MTWALTCALALLAAAASAAAHHSFAAELDGKKVVTIKGTITKFEWMNPQLPHTRIARFCLPALTVLAG